MEQYKLINAELISKVQKLKLDIAEYAREVTLLRAKLMDEHELRLNEKKMYYAENVQSICLKLLKDINPEVRIYFPTEKSDNGNVHNESAEDSTKRRTQQICRSDGSGRRSSSEIYDEMSRSNAVMRNRNSLTKSPRRSSTENYNRNTLTISPRESDSSLDSNSCEEVFDVEDDDEDDDEDEGDDQNFDKIVEQANTNGVSLYSIMEDDGTEEVESEKDCDVQSETDTLVSTIKAPVVETLSIQNITTQFQNVSLTKSKTVSPKASPKQKKQVNNNSNISSLPLLAITPATTSATTTDVQISPLRNVTNNLQNVTLVGKDKKLVPAKRNLRKPSKTVDDTENNITEIQTVRQNQHTLSAEPIEILHLTNSVNTLTPRKSTSANTVLNDTSQINMTQFNNLPSSTPCRQRETSSATNIAVLTMGTTTTTTTNESSNTSGGRPSRACRPTMLKEPNNRSKMRNELDVKTKKKRK